MHLKRKLLTVIAIVVALIITALIVLRVFFFMIMGTAMLPTLHPYDFGVVNIFDRKFARKDIVIYSVAGTRHKHMVSRIIGLPGEHVDIRNGDVYINGVVLDETEYWGDEAITHGTVSLVLDSDSYYVLSDNRGNALDSRVFGPVPEGDIRGEFILLKSLQKKSI